MVSMASKSSSLYYDRGWSLSYPPSLWQFTPISFWILVSKAWCIPSRYFHAAGWKNVTLQGTNISHLASSTVNSRGDVFVPRRVPLDFVNSILRTSNRKPGKTRERLETQMRMSHNSKTQFCNFSRDLLEVLHECLELADSSIHI